MNTAPIRILLVEDNPGDARLIREHLNAPDGPPNDTTVVDCVADAVEHLSTGAFDVVLLDLLLPDGSGVDTVTKVYGAAPTVPIVVMSGMNDEGLIARAVEEGAQDYLVKGHVNGALLRHAIRFAIERQRILNEKFIRLSTVAESMSPRRIAVLEEKVERLLELIQERMSD